MVDTSKIPVSIQLLDKTHFEGVSFSEIVDEAIAIINEEGANLKRNKLNGFDLGQFEVKAYYDYARYPPKWKEFLMPLLDHSSPLAKCENQIYSYVVFIGYQDSIFVITGGNGSLSVGKFLVPNFGLEIIVRLFDKNSKVVKHIQDRGLTGNLLGQTKFYRGDQRFSDENQFGKIFKQIQADLNKRILTKVFAFSEKELRKEVAGCLAKDSFKINKSIDFQTLLTLIERLHELLHKKANFSLNSVFHISKRQRQNKVLIEELEEWLIDTIYDLCKRGETVDIDFCHREYEKYLSAENYTIFIGKGETIEFDTGFGISDLISKLKFSESYFDEDVDLFRHSVLYRKIESKDEEGKTLTNGNVLDHINGEFNYNGKTYFRIDKEWYQILPSFIKDLNIECLELLNNALDDDLIPDRFDIKKREDFFNISFIGKDGFFVFDTITPDNIEACDLLKIDDNNLYLIHVKKGFDNSIRELSTQINIAAKRLHEDLRSGFSFIEELETLAKNGRKSNSILKQKIGNQNFPRGGISSLFKNKRPQNIFFCLAFVDKSDSGRELKNDLNKFNSNIAKFSLLELKRELNYLGLGFKICQLKKV